MTLSKFIEMEQSTAKRYLDKINKLEKLEDKDVYLAFAKYHIKIAEYLTELKMIKDRNGRE